MRREAAPRAVLCRVMPRLGHRPSLGPGGAETPPETLKLLTTSWGQKRQGRERVFINLAPVTALRNLRGEQLPHPRGNQRGKTPTHSKLRHPAEATEGASKSPSKFRTFGQTSPPAHLTSLPMAGPGCSSESQGHRWEPDPNPRCLHFCSIKPSARTSMALSLTPETAPGHRKGSEVGDGSSNVGAGC